MRQALEQAGVPEPARDRGRDGLSTFRAMLLALFQHNLIDRSLFRDLMGIGRYRNLASYGRVRRVDTAIIDQTRAALARLKALAPSAYRTAEQSGPARPTPSTPRVE